MENVIVLFGKPGAGKGTRLEEFLAGKENQFEVLSVGNLLRSEIANGTDVGKKAKSYMDAGQLVPDDIINEIAIKALKSATKPIFTDGFPRTVDQAEAMLLAGISPLVIEFYVDDEVVVERANNRIVCKNCGAPYTITGFKPPKVEGVCDKCNGKLVKRADDEESIVRNRLEVYQNETYPVLDFLGSLGIRTFSIDNNDPENARRMFAELVLASL